jgi:adenylate kinase
MILLITGTPGTGKSTLSRLLADKLDGRLVDINQLVNEKKLYSGHEPEKGYKVVDMEALEVELQDIVENNQDQAVWIIVEGHLSHYFPRADLVVVLRTHPHVLKDRLEKRGWKNAKIMENLQAEALDICTWEAYHIHGEKVHEVETSRITPEEALDIIIGIIMGVESAPAGTVDFSEYLET